MFWEKFISLCAKHKVSPNAVAKSIGISSAAVTHWKNGSAPRDTAIKKIANYFNISADYFNEETVKKLDLEKYGIKPIKLKKFRMLGEIACGEPIYANEDYETFIEASDNINADFCLTAKGDSMINARIFDGDIVFIKAQPDVENGEIAAVIIEDTVTLKRVYKYTNRIELRPENPTHRVQNYEGEELNHITILGKAVAFQSYIR